MARRVAVVLFNLGGPDAPEAVEPFLFNLFNDRAIIGLPGLLRWPLAKLIARRRGKLARDIYAKIGGASPLYANTLAQARALESALQGRGIAARCVVAMRYWRPFAAEAAAELRAHAPDEIVLLPLYPQFSTTTSASSFADWERAARAAGIAAPLRAVCCYPEDSGFVAALAASIRTALTEAGAPTPRLLFSAHGLPKRVVAGGDPYRWQVERTAAAVAEALGMPGLDWRVCYQSRVGPLEWIGPATAAEIERAGRDRVPLVVAPIAFVSEHSETLVELDIEYRHLAERAGVPRYIRVPTVGAAPEFVAGLAGLVEGALARPPGVRSGAGGRVCPDGFRRCGCEGAADA